MSLTYKLNEPISVEQFKDVLLRSTLAERRPIEETERLAGMLAHANLTLTAWQDNTLVGIARSVTDFHFCCYLSDLAVDENFQHQGIGKSLIEETRKQLQPGCVLLLISAPKAMDYYPKLGFEKNDRCWIKTS